jgi:hypothetical protein
VSGLWHGASLSYLIWGLLNGLFQVTSDIIRSVKAKLPAAFEIKNTFSGRMLRLVGTFTLVTFAWLFFRAGNLHTAALLIKNMFSVFNWTIFFDGSLYLLGVGRDYLFVAYLAIALLGIVDYLKYRGVCVADAVIRQAWWFRTCCIVGLVVFILLFGCYGKMYDAQQFIYFQF